MSTTETVRALLGVKLRASVRRAFERAGSAVDDRGLIDVKAGGEPWPARLLIVGEHAAWVSVHPRTGEPVHWSGRKLPKWA